MNNEELIKEIENLKKEFISGENNNRMKIPYNKVR